MLVLSCCYQRKLCGVNNALLFFYFFFGELEVILIGAHFENLIRFAHLFGPTFHAPTQQARNLLTYGFYLTPTIVCDLCANGRPISAAATHFGVRLFSFLLPESGWMNG